MYKHQNNRQLKSRWHWYLVSRGWAHWIQVNRDGSELDFYTKCQFNLTYSLRNACIAQHYLSLDKNPSWGHVYNYVLKKGFHLDFKLLKYLQNPTRGVHYV